MTRLTLADIPVIGPLIQQRIEEAKLQQRLTMDKGLSYVHHLLENKTGAAFVDDLLDPKAVVVCFVGEFGIMSERFCSVSLIYVDRASRASRKGIECVETVEAYARMENCDVIYGYTWNYRTAENVDKLWLHFGFEPQDTTFVKHLKSPASTPVSTPTSATNT